jgi:hypothetical protein
MAWLLNSRQKRAVAYAAGGRCSFAQATLRDEFRRLRREGVTNPLEDRAYRKASVRVRERCGSALGMAAPLRRRGGRR